MPLYHCRLHIKSTEDYDLTVEAPNKGKADLAAEKWLERCVGDYDDGDTEIRLVDAVPGNSTLIDLNGEYVANKVEAGALRQQSAARGREFLSAIDTDVKNMERFMWPAWPKDCETICLISPSVEYDLTAALSDNGQSYSSNARGRLGSITGIGCKFVVTDQREGFQVYSRPIGEYPQ